MEERKWKWSVWTLCDPMDCSLLGSSIHGIFQARILEWVAISFSRRSSQLRDWTQVSRIVGRCFTIWATREVIKCVILWLTEPFKAQETPPHGVTISEAVVHSAKPKSASQFPLTPLSFHHTQAHIQDPASSSRCRPLPPTLIPFF